MLDLVKAALPIGIMAATAVAAQPAGAHFQEIIPSPPLLGGDSVRSIDLAVTFTHPMENGPVMPMAAPAQIGVLIDGTQTDLTTTAHRTLRQGQPAYDLSYAVSAPGDHVFFVRPAPYWEPTEGKMIVHYAKVVVNAYGAEDGWDAMIGLPVEIEPLTRPYGLWTGSLFRGVVRQDGQPVSFAEVEVEYRSEGAVSAPTDTHVTQVVKADANGTFAVAMPRAGWWGFAALVEADAPMTAPTGDSVPVELGGLIWVHVDDMTKTQAGGRDASR